jgi:hypothetical protein
VRNIVRCSTQFEWHQTQLNGLLREEIDRSAAGVLTVLIALTALSTTGAGSAMQPTPAPTPLASRPPVGTVRRRAGSWSTPIKQSKSGLWVWVQCAGKDDTQHNYAATPALWLLHAAAHLDLNVMFCDMPLRDGIPAEYLQSLAATADRTDAGTQHR